MHAALMVVFLITRLCDRSVGMLAALMFVFLITRLCDRSVGMLAALMFVSYHQAV